MQKLLPYSDTVTVGPDNSEGLCSISGPLIEMPEINV